MMKEQQHVRPRWDPRFLRMATMQRELCGMRQQRARRSRLRMKRASALCGCQRSRRSTGSG